MSSQPFAASRSLATTTILRCAARHLYSRINVICLLQKVTAEEIVGVECVREARSLNAAALVWLTRRQYNTWDFTIAEYQRITGSIGFSMGEGRTLLLS